jgi:hypothetical protein
MPPRANVTSVEALEFFRSRLIVYLSQARPALEEASADVFRTRDWLENEQRTRWENEARRRKKALEQAQSALFSAKLSTLSKSSSVEQLAFHKAKRALDEAEAKLRLLKQWNREFDNRAQPLVKQMEKLHHVLSQDMIQAAAYLAQAAKTLATYAGVAPPSDSTGPAGAGGLGAAGGGKP